MMIGDEEKHIVVSKHCLVILAREKAATELSVIISMSREKKKSTAADDTCIYCIRSTILLSKDNLFVIYSLPNSKSDLRRRTG